MWRSLCVVVGMTALRTNRLRTVMLPEAAHCVRLDRAELGLEALLRATIALRMERDLS
ncbi:hypothetical protein [Solidesulfovibrio sp. C21]|uniref:hypothetical protein n=1 Tax=Solidesulfovibrio sp. C21 TaxID=3398613 RepID=UPI0039FCA71C